MEEQKLTLKQRKFLDAYLETGNATEAARRAGYGGNDADLACIGSENLRKLKIPIQDRMNAMGLDDQSLMRKLMDGLDATLVKIASDHGRISDERTYADYGTRAKYLDMALRLKGMLEKKAAQDDSDSAAAPISITINTPQKSD